MYFSDSQYEEMHHNRKVLKKFLRLIEPNQPLVNSQPIMVIPINKDNQKILPLKFLQYTVEIIGSLAYITLKQE